MADRRKVLYVEGKKDKFVIAEIAEASGIPWPRGKEPIDIRDLGGDAQLVDADRIATRLKESGLQAMGIIVDADENPAARWQQVRHACAKSISDMPTELPSTGLVHPMQNGIKLGIWMMPDNQLRGMLETFLAYLVEPEAPLWQYARSTVEAAKLQGAPFKPTHYDKANIHTWLAWQNEPGEQLHVALQKRILNGQHPKAQEFVNWLKQLYEL
jgi:hypothetical protein